MLHLFRFDPRAVYVSPDGSRTRFRHGAWACVMCRQLLGFCVTFGLDHADDCPGLVSSVSLDLEL